MAGLKSSKEGQILYKRHVRLDLLCPVHVLFDDTELFSWVFVAFSASRMSYRIRPIFCSSVTYGKVVFSVTVHPGKIALVD